MGQTPGREVKILHRFIKIVRAMRPVAEIDKGAAAWFIDSI
jgi:hypothetical protein